MIQTNPFQITPDMLATHQILDRSMLNFTTELPSYINIERLLPPCNVIFLLSLNSVQVSETKPYLSNVCLCGKTVLDKINSNLMSSFLGGGQIGIIKEALPLALLLE